MKLMYLHYPVQDMEKSLEFYRDILGFQESWRLGNQTVAFKIPNCEQEIMLDQDENDIGAGGVFLVDSVEEYYKEYKSKVEFVIGPIDIPPGKYAVFIDNSGNRIRILDFSKENNEEK